MLHSPPSSTHGTVRIDLGGGGEETVKDSRDQRATHGSVASQKRSAERRDQPAVAVGEGEDVMLVVFQTRHATCRGSGGRVINILELGT